MRSLPVLNVYSLDALEYARWSRVRTPEDCVKEEAKLAEYRQVVSELNTNRSEYKDEKSVDRVINRMNCSVNFLLKQCSRFTNVADAVIKQRRDLELRRSQTQQKLEDAKMERQAAVDAATAKADVPAAPPSDNGTAVAVAKKKPGRPKKSR